jgi:hypothetical protein
MAQRVLERQIADDWWWVKHHGRWMATRGMPVTWRSSTVATWASRWQGLARPRIRLRLRIRTNYHKIPISHCSIMPRSWNPLYSVQFASVPQTAPKQQNSPSNVPLNVTELAYICRRYNAHPSMFRTPWGRTKHTDPSWRVGGYTSCHAPHPLRRFGE